MSKLIKSPLLKPLLGYTAKLQLRISLLPSYILISIIQISRIILLLFPDENTKKTKPTKKTSTSVNGMHSM